jgi:hypothetical protein
MGRTSFFLIGAVVGAAVGLAIDYVFGPTKDALFDERYRSRWDHALEEGERAADEREAELRRQFTAAKRSRPRSSADDARQLPDENDS